MIDFTITTNKKEAAKVILAALDEGSLHYQRRNDPAIMKALGGDTGRLARYYQEFPDKTIGRCAIGQLFSVEQAMVLEDDPDGYKLARQLIQDEILIVPEDEEDWFPKAQRLHDDGELDDLRKMCEIAIAA